MAGEGEAGLVQSGCTALSLGAASLAAGCGAVVSVAAAVAAGATGVGWLLTSAEACATVGLVGAAAWPLQALTTIVITRSR